MEECKSSGRIPVVDMHTVFAELGILVDQAVNIVGDPRSGEGAVVATESVRLESGIDTIRHGNTIVAMKDDDNVGEFICRCQGSGSGACRVITTQTQGGDDAISCEDENCGQCKMFVKLPQTEFNAAVLSTLGVELPEDVPVHGDITSREGLLVDTDTFRLSDDFEGDLDDSCPGTVILMRNGDTRGTFSCSCTTANATTTGGCLIQVNRTAIICKRDSCRNCGLVVRVPSVATGAI